MKILGFVGVALLAAVGTASAGPSTRFGLTFAAEDQAAPGNHELGPTLAVGERMGPLTLEVDYAYLSFMDSHTSAGGIHRLGVNLRADVLRMSSESCRRFMACTRGSSLFAEAGIAERYGQWHLDAHSSSPNGVDRVREAHLGIGIELDNHVVPYRYGWQFGLRFTMSPHDSAMDPACRSTTCAAGTQPTSTSQSGIDKAILVDWTFLIGS